LLIWGDYGILSYWDLFGVAAKEITKALNIEISNEKAIE
jgi:hypothetical protein